MAPVQAVIAGSSKMFAITVPGDKAILCEELLPWTVLPLGPEVVHFDQHRQGVSSAGLVSSPSGRYSPDENQLCQTFSPCFDPNDSLWRTVGCPVNDLVVAPIRALEEM